MPSIIGQAGQGLVITFEHSRGPVRLRGCVLRRQDGRRVELDGMTGETMAALKRRLMEGLGGRMSISVGDRVTMTQAWRQRVGIDTASFYRGEDGALFPKTFKGVVLRLYERTFQINMDVVTTEDRAVVRHKPEDCGCDLKSSGTSCPRCQGTGVAVLRFLRVEDLEQIGA